MSHISRATSRLLQRQLGLDPALAPDAERLDERLQFAAGLGQVVFEHAGLARRGDARMTMPAASSSFSRCDSRAGDIRGTPRRRSLKRVEPAISSRSSTMVQRVHRISAAIATGQNWLIAALGHGVLRD